MKTQFNRLSYLLLFFLLFSEHKSLAQAGSAILYRFTNLTQLNATTFRYDLYCINTGTTTLQLRGYSWGLNLTPGFANGGTITHSFISRDPVLSTIPSVSVVYTATTYHLRGTTTNAATGNEVNLPAGVPIRLGTCQVVTSTSFVDGINPFLPVAPTEAIQNSTVPGKTACVATCKITPPGNSYTMNGPTNALTSINLNVMSVEMVPSPTGATPFLFSSCPTICAPIVTHTNVSSCNSYVWNTVGGNGQTYTNSGVYTNTVQQGTCPCYDTNYLHLTINSSSSSFNTVTACGSYNWSLNGATYTSSGVYTHTSLNSVGCIHTDSLILNITSTSGSQINVTTCDSYTWSSNATTYTQSGTYYNLGSCGSDTLNLTILNSTHSNTIVSACNSYLWMVNNVTYTTSGIYINNSNNSSGCIQTDTLQLTLNQDSIHTQNVVATSSYTWPINSATYTVSGTYIATFTMASGCTLTETLSLIINAPSATTALMNFTNFVQTAPNVFTYDVVFTNTGTTTLGLRGYSCGINTNPGIANGGTLSQTFVSRDPLFTSFPAVTPASSLQTVTCAGSYHLRLTTTTASTGNEINIAPGGSILLARMQVQTSATSFPTNFNPFTQCAAIPVLQNLPVAGKTQCLTTCIVSTSGTSYILNDPANTPTGTLLNVMSLAMTPSPSSTNPFLLNSCSTTCVPVVNHLNVTACDMYTWTSPVGTGITYYSSGTYYNVVAQGICPCYDTTYLHLTMLQSTSSSVNATSCSSYTWSQNGATYTASGIYTTTSTNSSGCTQTDSLYLLITPTGGTQQTITACDTYTWTSNFVTYTQSGVYFNTGTCGSDTLNLTINNSSITSNVVNACNSYTWTLNSTTYTQSGTYIHTMLNASGCSQIDTLHLLVNYDSTHTTNLSIPNNSYYWNITATTYTASGTYSTTMNTAAGCVLTEVLNLTLNSFAPASALMTFTNFVQISPNAFTYDVMLTNTGTSALALRGYSFGLNTATGIANGGNITHTFVTRSPSLNNIPSLTPASTLQIGTCASSYHLRATTTNATAGNEFALTAGVPILIARMKVQTSASAFPSSYNPFATCSTFPVIQNLVTAGKTQCVVTCIITPPGTSYTMNGPTNSNTSSNINTLSVSMIPDPSSASAFMLNPSASCTSELLSTTTISSCDLYTWALNGLTYTASGIYDQIIPDGTCSDTNRLVLTINPSTTSFETDTASNSFLWNANGVTYTASGIYTHTSLNAQGCTHISTLNLILINSGCSIPFTVIEDQPISCHGNNDGALQASTTSAGTYTFSIVSPTTGSSSNSSGYFNHLEPGTHTVFITDGITTCAQTITFIEPDSLDISFITDSLVSCQGNDGQLSINITGGTNILQGYLTWWTNSAGDTLNDVLTNNFALTLDHLPAGNYNVAVEDDRGCFYNETGSIQVADPLIVSASFNPILCHNGFTSILPSSTGGVTYSPIVYTVNGNPIAPNYSSGSYTITATDAKGCSATTVMVISNPILITGASTIVACNSYTWNGTTYTAAGMYTATFMASNGCDSIHTLNLSFNNGVMISVKALLSGAYKGGGLMQDSLRAKNVLPLIEPYTNLNFTPIGCPGYNGGETILPAILSTTGNNAIVDWVHIEIRNSDASYSKVATQNALIQRDGDVVDINGDALSFACVCPGNYFVTIKHRNHLGVMTATSLALSSTVQQVDFTTSAPVWTKPGVFSPTRETNGAYRLLWPGDTRTDKNTKYNGLNNDKEPILSAIGVATPNNILQPVYRTEDANLDARVKYNNTDNDKNFILNKIILSGYPSGTSNDVITQHTPN